MLARVAMHNEFGHHGVVVGADGVALAHAVVKANRAALESGVRGLFVNLQMTCGRQEIVVGVFGADARFNGVACEFDLRLLKWQWLATGHTQLPLDQVQTCHGFGHRMLHLQAGVHLHEEEVHVDLASGFVIALLNNEFNGTSAHIIHGTCSRHGSFAHLFAQLCRHAGCRRFFQHLLVTTLNRTIALHEVYAVALCVAKHLNFNVPRTLHIFFNQHGLIAKTVLRFALARGQGVCKVF